MVGLSTFVSVFMTMHALKGFVEHIDGMLPRPIFSSVADMTRVTIWEAKRSLQIGNNMGHIQWVEATRNGTGGIDLIGLHRAEPELDRNNNPLHPKVRAQRYVIQTDMWGRILNTVVRDTWVSHATLPYRPQSEATSHQATPPPPPHYLTISPPPPTGEDLAQGFFTESQPPSPHQPSKHRIIRQASNSQSNQSQSQPTAVHTKSRPQPIIEPTIPIDPNEDMYQRFARILHKKFTDNELQELFAGIGLRYGQTPGTRLELCQDLVRFYRRRQRLKVLANKAVNMHPGELWGDIVDLIDN